MLISFVAPSPCSNAKDCKLAGRFRCARCKAWYCSQTCQIQHWFKHKLECVAPPPLESPEGSVVSVEPSGEEIALREEFRKKLRTTSPKVAKKHDKIAIQSPRLFPSALSSLKVGYISQLYAAESDTLDFETSSFLAVCCDKDSAFDYIFGDMQEEMENMLRTGELQAATNVCPGALVLAKNKEEEYGRCIVLATRGTLNKHILY